MDPGSLLAALGVALFAGMASAAPPPDNAELVRQVMDAERAFAASMELRDHEAFSLYLSDEAVFFASEGVLRGKAAVADGWRRYFETQSAPFSWEPDVVEVLDSGTLALSSGPVRDPEGRVIARFNSIWRREGPGVWRVVFDKGSPVCGD